MRWKEREGGGGSRVCFMFACHDAQRFSTIRPTLVFGRSLCRMRAEQTAKIPGSAFGALNSHFRRGLLLPRA